MFLFWSLGVQPLIYQSHPQWATNPDDTKRAAKRLHLFYGTQGNLNNAGVWLLREEQYTGAPAVKNIILGTNEHGAFKDGIPCLITNWTSPKTGEVTTTQRITIREYTKQKEVSGVIQSPDQVGSNHAVDLKKADTKHHQDAVVYDLEDRTIDSNVTDLESVKVASNEAMKQL